MLYVVYQKYKSMKKLNTVTTFHLKTDKGLVLTIIIGF